MSKAREIALEVLNTFDDMLEESIFDDYFINERELANVVVNGKPATVYLTIKQDDEIQIGLSEIRKN